MTNIHTLVLHLVAIWQRYEYFTSNKHFENGPKCAKHGLSIKVSNWIRTVPQLILERV